MNGVVVGIDTPTTNDQAVVSELGRTPAIIDGFFSWTEPFPSAFVGSVESMGSTPMVTWLPSGAAGTGGRGAGYSLASIVSGQADPYISQWASAARRTGRPILVRLMHEMNGDWYPWGAGVNGNTPQEYVTAFQHVVTVVRNAGASNVQFVWCVATSAASSLGRTAATPISAFFPGDDYVSWVAMDGYNRKATRPRSFYQIFSDVYGQLTQLSQRPVMVPETATVEMPGDPQYKASWIASAFQSIPSAFPRMKAVLYFDSSGNGYSYPFDSNPAAIAALRSVLASPEFEATVPSQPLAY